MGETTLFMAEKGGFPHTLFREKDIFGLIAN